MINDKDIINDIALGNIIKMTGLKNPKEMNKMDNRLFINLNKPGMYRCGKPIVDGVNVLQGFRGTKVFQGRPIDSMTPQQRAYLRKTSVMNTERIMNTGDRDFVANGLDCHWQDSNRHGFFKKAFNLVRGRGYREDEDVEEDERNWYKRQKEYAKVKEMGEYHNENVKQYYKDKESGYPMGAIPRNHPKVKQLESDREKGLDKYNKSQVAEYNKLQKNKEILEKMKAQTIAKLDTKKVYEEARNQTEWDAFRTRASGFITGKREIRERQNARDRAALGIKARIAGVPTLLYKSIENSDTLSESEKARALNRILVQKSKMDRVKQLEARMKRQKLGYSIRQAKYGKKRPMKQKIANYSPTGGSYDGVMGFMVTKSQPSIMGNVQSGDLSGFFVTKKK